MPSAYSTIRVICFVLAIAVARVASMGSAFAGSYYSGAANLSCSSAQLLVPFTSLNHAAANRSLTPKSIHAKNGHREAKAIFGDTNRNAVKSLLKI